jgi:hypothetical protein
MDALNRVRLGKPLDVLLFRRGGGLEAHRRPGALATGKHADC